MKVALILDNPKRDLNGLALVSFHLLKAGIEVFIVPMYQQGHDIPLIGPEAVVANYVRPQNEDLLRVYKAVGSMVCILDTEGGVLSETGSDSPENWARAFRDRGWKEVVDHYFFWGSALHEAFATLSGMPVGRLHLTGCPRYDYCVPPWSSLHAYTIDGYLLVNTNFSAINPKFTRSAESEVTLFTEGGWGRSYVQDLFTELTEVFPRFLDAIAELAQNRPRRTVVVRPHPFENTERYVNRFRDLPNIVVDDSGDVLNVISHAECVVHLNCGTAVESNLLGKDPISMDFLNSEVMRRHAPLPSRISISARSIDDLCELAESRESRMKRGPSHGIRLQRLRPWFHEVDGQAALRVALTLERLTVRPERKARSRIWNAMRGGREHPRLAQRLQGLACFLFGSRVIAGLREVVSQTRVSKRAEPADVAEKIRRIGRAAADPATFSVGYARHPVSRLPLASVRLSPR